MNKTRLLAFFLPAALFAKIDYDYIRISKRAVSPQWIQSAGFIEDHRRNENYLIGYLPRTSRVETHIRDSITTLDATEWSQKLFDVETLKEIALPERTEGSPYEEFHTYETLTTELKSLAAKYPHLVTLESAGKTVQGREMWLVRLTKKSNQLPSKPKVLLISSMHGDEVTGKELMVYLIRLLLAKSMDKSTTDWLDANELFIIPSMNPDGTERHQRFNADGVDLNRDFPLLDESPTDPNRAIEAKNIQALHQKHHFIAALNFHGGEICVNIPWDSKNNTLGALFGDNALMMGLARTYANANLPMKNNHAGNFNHGVTYGYEWYPVYGGMQDWATHFYQSTHATVEVSEIKWPSASSLPGFWKDNQTSLLSFVEKSTTGAHLRVSNQKGDLLPVEIDIASAKRTLKYNGYVHRPSSALTEKVTVKSVGYQSKELDVTSTRFNGTLIDVILEK